MQTSAIEATKPIRHTVLYGPDYNEQLSTILGSEFSYRALHTTKTVCEIDSCPHTGGGTMRAFRTFLSRETGKVIKVLIYGVAYDAVLEFADRAAYTAYDRALRAAEVDPETGRPFRG